MAPPSKEHRESLVPASLPSSSENPDKPHDSVGGLRFDSDGRSLEVRFFSLQGPHHRTFHVSWTAFFVAMIAIFGSAPLLETIKDPEMGIGLDEVSIGTAHAASMAAFPYRFMMGSLCDRFGPRRTVAATLLAVSVPTALLALCTDAASFICCRFFCGLLWSVAVGCQVQMSAMFAPSVIGSANGLCLGIGSAGVGVALLLMPQLHHLLKFFFPAQVAWRVALLFPALLLFLSAFATFTLSQDSPSGNLAAGRRGADLSAVLANLRAAATDLRTWTMHVVCALCLGVGWVVSNVIVRFYEIHFRLDNRSAGLVGALFGLNNAYARVFGGVLSDRVARSHGHLGRTRLFFLFLVLEALSMAAFSRAPSLPVSALLFWLLACFVQICEGFAFSVIPLLNPQLVGSVASLAGAGANVGAFFFSFLFASPVGQPHAFLILAAIVAVLAPLVLTVRVAAPAAPPPLPPEPAAAAPGRRRRQRRRGGRRAAPEARPGAGRRARLLDGAAGRSPAVARPRRTAGLGGRRRGGEREGRDGRPRHRLRALPRLPAPPHLPRRPRPHAASASVLAHLPPIRLPSSPPPGPGGAAPARPAPAPAVAMRLGFEEEEEGEEGWDGGGAEEPKAAPPSERRGGRAPGPLPPRPLNDGPEPHIISLSTER
eukprot:tig00020556_g11004.t1